MISLFSEVATARPAINNSSCQCLFKQAFYLGGIQFRSHRCFLFATRHKTVGAFGQGPRTHTFLDLYSRFSQSPTFSKHFPILCALLCVSLSLISFTNSALNSSSTLILETRRHCCKTFLRHFHLPAVAKRLLD